MSHHNNDVCGKPALTYKDSAEGLAETWVVRRQGAGLRTARYLPVCPAKRPQGARSLGKEDHPRFAASLVPGFKPARASGYETCRLEEGFFPLHFFFFFLEEPQD